MAMIQASPVSDSRFRETGALTDFWATSVAPMANFHHDGDHENDELSREKRHHDGDHDNDELSRATRHHDGDHDNDELSRAKRHHDGDHENEESK